MHTAQKISSLFGPTKIVDAASKALKSQRGIGQ